MSPATGVSTPEGMHTSTEICVSVTNFQQLSEKQVAMKGSFHLCDLEKQGKQLQGGGPSKITEQGQSMQGHNLHR